MLSKYQPMLSRAPAQVERAGNGLRVRRSAGETAPAVDQATCKPHLTSSARGADRSDAPARTWRMSSVGWHGSARTMTSCKLHNMPNEQHAVPSSAYTSRSSAHVPSSAPRSDSGTSAGAREATRRSGRTGTGSHASPRPRGHRRRRPRSLELPAPQLQTVCAPQVPAAAARPASRRRRRPRRRGHWDALPCQHRSPEAREREAGPGIRGINVAAGTQRVRRRLCPALFLCWILSYGQPGKELVRGRGTIHGGARQAAPVLRAAGAARARRVDAVAERRPPPGRAAVRGHGGVARGGDRPCARGPTVLRLLLLGQRAADGSADAVAPANWRHLGRAQRRRRERHATSQRHRSGCVLGLGAAGAGPGGCLDRAHRAHGRQMRAVQRARLGAGDRWGERVRRAYLVREAGLVPRRRHAHLQTARATFRFHHRGWLSAVAPGAVVATALGNAIRRGRRKRRRLCSPDHQRRPPRAALATGPTMQ